MSNALVETRMVRYMRLRSDRGHEECVEVYRFSYNWKNDRLPNDLSMAFWNKCFSFTMLCTVVFVRLGEFSQVSIRFTVEGKAILVSRGALGTPLFSKDLTGRKVLLCCRFELLLSIRAKFTIFFKCIYLKAFSITPKTEREWLFFELLF